MSRNDWYFIGSLVVLASLIGGVASVGYSSIVQKIARAIAVAERGAAEINSGTIARNNPGDIEDGNGNLIVYPTLQDGWNALYHQVSLMFCGSQYYDPSMSIAQIAQTYVGTSDWSNWANNVANQLGVSPDTPLSQIT
jgi:hypothetical protein